MDKIQMYAELKKEVTDPIKILGSKKLKAFVYVNGEWIKLKGETVERNIVSYCEILKLPKTKPIEEYYLDLAMLLEGYFRAIHDDKAYKKKANDALYEVLFCKDEASFAEWLKLKGFKINGRDVYIEEYPQADHYSLDSFKENELLVLLKNYYIKEAHNKALETNVRLFFLMAAQRIKDEAFQKDLEAHMDEIKVSYRDIWDYVASRAPYKK